MLAMLLIKVSTKNVFSGILLNPSTSSRIKLLNRPNLRAWNADDANPNDAEKIKGSGANDRSRS